jgi:uncharacterized membrane protein
MAAATYLTRCLGYLVMRDREFGPGARAVFDAAAPGSVLLAVIVQIRSSAAEVRAAFGDEGLYALLRVIRRAGGDD